MGEQNPIFTEIDTVAVDLENTTYLGYAYFIYPVYVRPNNGKGKSCSFRVQVLPSGTFADKVADVSFHVGEGAQLEDGVIRIPLYNIYSKSLLQGHPGAKLQLVTLSGDTKLDITLSNALPDLAIGLYPELQVSRGTSPTGKRTHKLRCAFPIAARECWMRARSWTAPLC